ncbi:Ubiquitin [Cordyceps fumosorosea ARSEF 2679]|uniref:Ubiquitin n=1 Tax=Cordyceps fumosorosea (strain ARSEF 2679) TaxID=1081104 RepID=A0A168E7D2_CORFA|nr:Ubiquitin [Cordyceps fumosorosea ARSEF 2679]OAA73458.1 Ubiquitin [Cordyceps fumosorosea ARSEF 2679]
MVGLTATKKKLPFEPTALRKARLKAGSNSGTGHDAPKSSVGERERGDEEEAQGEEEDSLALFRRAKEMAPIVKADREWQRRRQLQKQKEQEEEEARKTALESNSASAGSKHTLTEEEDGDVDVVQASTPMASSALAMSEDDIMATREASNNRELMTPPSSKRSRHGFSTSSTEPNGPGLTNTAEAPDSPTMRTLRSLAPDRSMTPALFATNLHGSGASTPTYNTRAQTRKSGNVPAGSQVICLDSDSEPETAAPVAAAPVGIASKDESLDLDLDLGIPAIGDDDDDEFADYVRKAQEERDRHNLQKERAAEAASLFSPTVQPEGAASSLTPEPARDTIDIVVTSDIPDTKGCLIKFYFDRPLRKVRDSWLSAQRRKGLPLERIFGRDEDAVLTWRRKKVYMSSTLLSLGIRPGEDDTGVPLTDGRFGGGGDGFNESGTRVHMQVWTPELFAEMEREEERRLQQELSADRQGVDGEREGEGREDGEGEEAEAPATLRITLRAKSGEPVRLKVLPETTTETVVAAYRAQREVPEAVDVGLWFDGMRLAPDATMEDADIDDMDTIEVHEK